jgi:integrase
MSSAKGRNCWETSPGSWAYSFTVKGQRYTGTVKGTKRDAERFIRYKRDRVKAEHFIGEKANGGHGSRDMTLLDAIDRYWSEIGQHAKAAEEDETHFNRLLDRIGEDTPITRIDDRLMSEIVGEWRQKYRHDNPALGRLSNAYVNRTVTELLRRVLIRARKTWKVPLPDEPNWTNLRLREAPRVREVTLEEEFKLQEKCREDYWPVFEFSLLTGLRKENAFELQWSQVDWFDRVIRMVAKRDTPRETIITNEVAEILEAQCGHHPTAVFTFIAKKTWTNPKNKVRYIKGQRYPITYEGCDSAWRKLRKDAKVKNLTLHDLRKTTGSRIVRATGNIAAASKQLGHESIALTARHYAHIMPEDVHEVNVRTAEVMREKREALKARRSADSQKNLKNFRGNVA